MPHMVVDHDAWRPYSYLVSIIYIYICLASSLNLKSNYKGRGNFSSYKIDHMSHSYNITCIISKIIGISVITEACS